MTNIESLTLADEFGARWRRDGFVVLRNLFPAADLSALSREIFAVFLSRFEKDIRDIGAGPSVVTHYYHAEKEGWRQCASRLPYLPALAALAGRSTLVTTAQRLGLAAPLFSTPPEIRIDMPEDQQYQQPWHQDWRYGQSSFNAITLWTPLHDVTIEQGALQVAPGSHRFGLLETEELENPRRFSIRDERFHADEARSVPVSLGESIIFSQFLVHRSGINSSSHPRLSFQIRFADLLEPNFRANGYRIPRSSDLIWTRLPTADDMVPFFGAERD